MKSIGAGTFKSKASYEVISDTGTSFIGGPKSVTDRLAKAVGAKVCIFWPNRFIILKCWHVTRITHPRDTKKSRRFQYLRDEESYEIPCKAKPVPIDIYIGANKYSIKPVNYIVNVSEFFSFPLLNIFATVNNQAHKEEAVERLGSG